MFGPEGPRIGIDIGRVVIDDSADEDELFFSRDYLSAPEVPGAFDAISKPGTWATCFLVSKTGTRKKQHSSSWLFAHRFPQRSGITDDRWHFTETRAGKGVLAEQLRLDGFVDDRAEVLAAMPAGVRCLVLFGSRPQTTEKAVRASDWAAALTVLTEALPDS